MKRLLFVALLFISGCAGSVFDFESTQSHRVEWADGLASGDQMWLFEANLHFHKRCVVIGCHGSVDDGRWMCYPEWANGEAVPVETVARSIRAVVPKEQPVILLICNKGAATLHVPGVWYAKNIVWTNPGVDWRRNIDGEVVQGIGKISEFVEGSEDAKHSSDR